MAAREEERRRCARELHDETLQALGALRVQLSSARRSSDVETLQAALDGAVSELGQEIANLRMLISDLRPAALDELGLEAALEALFERIERRHRFALETFVSVDERRGRLPDDVETAVYRIVQEALTNVVRHAAARHVDVHLVEHAGEITLSVRDDGRGFEPSRARHGFGIAGIRERVELVGGQLHIRSSAAGTELTAVLPAARERVVRRARSLMHS